MDENNDLLKPEWQEPILSCDWKKTNMHGSIFFWIYLKPYNEVEWVIYSYNRVRKRKDFMSKRNEPCFLFVVVVQIFCHNDYRIWLCAQTYILKEMDEESILCLWILAWSSIYIVKNNFFFGPCHSSLTKSSFSSIN